MRNKHTHGLFLPHTHTHTRSPIFYHFPSARLLNWLRHSFRSCVQVSIFSSLSRTRRTEEGTNHRKNPESYFDCEHLLCAPIIRQPAGLLHIICIPRMHMYFSFESLPHHKISTSFVCMTVPNKKIIKRRRRRRSSASFVLLYSSFLPYFTWNESAFSLARAVRANWMQPVCQAGRGWCVRAEKKRKNPSRRVNL